jgi:hypothetical protein
MRREFILPEQDVDFLNALGLPWETLMHGGCSWLIISDYPVPPGFTVASVQIALQIQVGYPVVQIDMAYFFPHLQLVSQAPIGALTFQPIDGNIFQRWSRHRTPDNPWRPGIDDLSTHLSAINSWLIRELVKK